MNIIDNGNEKIPGRTVRGSMDLEYIRARDFLNQGKDLQRDKSAPVPDADYRLECDVLPKNFLDGFNLDSMLPDDFQTMYMHDSICCLAVLPFDDLFYGQRHLTSKKWEAFIKSKNYLRALMVYPTTGITQGFGDIPACYHDLLPEILRRDIAEGGASFKVDYKRKDNKSDRQWFLEISEKALNNLRKFFGQHQKRDHLRLVK